MGAHIIDDRPACEEFQLGTERIAWRYAPLAELRLLITLAPNFALLARLSKATNRSNDLPILLSRLGILTQ